MRDEERIDEARAKVFIDKTVRGRDIESEMEDTRECGRDSGSN